MNIGENLAQLRRDKQISVYKLSQLSDVSINYIRRVEKGESIPSIEILTALLSPLGMHLSEFSTRNPIYSTRRPMRQSWSVSTAS